MMAGPAGRDRRVPGLHPRPRKPPPTRRRANISRRPGSAARACSTSSASCRTRNIASRSIPRTATTATHPLVVGANPGARADAAEAIPPGTSRSIPALEARFQRVKAKLLGFVDPKQAMIKYPESDQSVPAHYARAYAYHIGGYPDKANARGQRAARQGPARSLLPRAQGPDPARRRQAQGRDRAASRGGPALGRRCR